MAGCVNRLFLILTVISYFRIYSNAFIPQYDLDDEPLYDYGTNIGDTEVTDYSTLDINPIELPFNISYFGASYKKIYISKDGLLSFDEIVTYHADKISAEGSVASAYDVPFIAPFWHKGYAHINRGRKYEGKIFNRTLVRNKLNEKFKSDYQRMLDHLDVYIPSTVVNPPEKFRAEIVIVVTWVGVRDEKQMKDKSCSVDTDCPTATFQAVVVADKENTFVIFNYKEMGIEIPADENYLAGFNGGARRGWYNVIPCQEECRAALNTSVLYKLPETKGSNLIGRYILSVGHEVIIRGGCLPEDIMAGTLEVYPREVGMFGGEILEVSGKCSPKAFKCRFRYGGENGDLTTVTSDGQMKSGNMKGFCTVPRMSWKGPTEVSTKLEGESEWSTHRTITVVLPEQIKKDVQIDMTNLYSKDAETISLRWNPRVFTDEPNANVEIILLKYTESDKYPRYEDVELLGTVGNDLGAYTIRVKDKRCKDSLQRTMKCADLELGLIEIKLQRDLHSQATKRVAEYFGPIPMGWYVNEEMTETVGSDWSEQKCVTWNELDSTQTDWINELIPCPCSLDQALADFGRFQADSSCNLFTGSKCDYHVGAKHCVRSVVPSGAGAGNQCCYNPSGNLVYSQLSTQGSTPDRGHVWGSHPYGTVDRVPSLSHWLHDVVSYYHCCLWTDRADLCRLYMDLRPTPDCTNYDVPGIAFLRGDSHITTFDGKTYRFGGQEEFWLVKAPGLKIQGKFGKANDKGAPKQSALVMLAVKAANAPEVFVWPAPTRARNPRGLDVLVQNERRFFDKPATMWQDFMGGLSILNNALDQMNNPHNNFTILLANNVGINVVASQGSLQVKVALPPDMKTSGAKGLLGLYDENVNNDLTPRQGPMPSSDPQEIYQDFSFSWKVSQDESLFNNYSPAKDIKDYEPYYEYDDIDTYPDIPSESSINGVCGGNDACEWAYKTTGSSKIGRDTLRADEEFAYVRQSAKRIDSCGLPAVGKMAVMDQYNFSVSQTVRVEGCGRGRYFSGGQTLTCTKESLADAEENDRLGYGYKRQDPLDPNTYNIIHWLPEPEVVCLVEDPNAANIPLIVGISVGGVVLVIIIVVIVVVCMRNKKKGSHKPSRGRNSERDPDAADTMLKGVSDRSPVYKPSVTNSVRAAPRGSKGEYGQVRGSEV